jgi:hypothetical protein
MCDTGSHWVEIDDDLPRWVNLGLLQHIEIRVTGCEYDDTLAYQALGRFEGTHVTPLFSEGSLPKLCQRIRNMLRHG